MPWHSWLYCSLAWMSRSIFRASKLSSLQGCSPNRCVSSQCDTSSPPYPPWQEYTALQGDVCGAKVSLEGQLMPWPHQSPAWGNAGDASHCVQWGMPLAFWFESCKLARVRPTNLKLLQLASGMTFWQGLTPSSFRVFETLKATRMICKPTTNPSQDG